MNDETRIESHRNLNIYYIKNSGNEDKNFRHAVSLRLDIKFKLNIALKGKMNDETRKEFHGNLNIS